MARRISIAPILAVLLFACGAPDGLRDSEPPGSGAPNPDYVFSQKAFQEPEASATRGARWWSDRPTLDDFRARFNEFPERAWLPRSVEFDEVGTGTHDRVRFLIGIPGDEGIVRLQSVDPAGVCRGQCWPTDVSYEVVKGDPYRQGIGEIIEHGANLLSGRFVADSPASRPSEELWEAWVYAHTVAARTLHETNEMSPFECFDAGDVACYLVTRARELGNWASSAGCSDEDAPELPPVPQGVGLDTIEDARIDLERFLVGALIQLAPPSTEPDPRAAARSTRWIYGRILPLPLLALLTADVGLSWVMNARFAALATDSSLDRYNRSCAARALDYLSTVDPDLSGAVHHPYCFWTRDP